MKALIAVMRIYIALTAKLFSNIRTELERGQAKPKRKPMYNRLILSTLFGLFVLSLTVQGMATKHSGDPFCKKPDGYVTSDFTHDGTGAADYLRGTGGSGAALAAKKSEAPGQQPEASDTSNQQAKSIRYYLYDSRLPDAGRILPGGVVVTS